MAWNDGGAPDDGGAAPSTARRWNRVVGVRWLACVTLLATSACSGPGPDAADAADRAVAPGGPGDASIEEQSAAERLIRRSIAFHDPQGLWATGTFRILQRASRPDGPDRIDHVTLDNGAGVFRLVGERNSRSVDVTVGPDDAVEVLVDGAQPEEELATELRLDRAGALRTRNYHLYLFGLPMKLEDPGTIVDPQVRAVEFGGRPAQEVQVSYTSDVGSDVWTFTFDPGTAEMIGCRFVQADGDAERILLEGLVEIDGLRLPERRTWYVTGSDELLGSDVLSQG